MSVSILIAVVVSFFATLFFTPKLIIFLQRIGMVGTDIQKKDRPKIAEMGGPAVLFGFLSGMFVYIWIKVFLYGGASNIDVIFAAITTVIIITFIGMFDDLSALMKKAEGGFKRIGLKQWQKPLLTLPAALPLMAIMAGNSAISVPFIGLVDIGVVYPLLLVPLAIVGASNAYNMLAGLNGLEAGLGVVLLSALGTYAYVSNETSAAIVAFVLAASLLAFIRFNWYPAKIMPGDSLTYLIGAAVATIAVIGNMEKFALLAFAPWILEFFLKTRSKFKAQNFGVLQSDNTLMAPYPGIYSLTHIVMKMGRFKEWQIVSAIIAFEAVVCAFLLWFYFIFL